MKVAMQNQYEESVRPECLYRADHIKRLMGWGNFAWRSAKKNGLRVLVSGNRRYVIGSDVIDWLKSINQK